MKKILLIFFGTLALLFLTSCRSRPELPRGVWESQYPHIILYIDPMYTLFTSDAYLGIATIGGEEVRVRLGQGSVGNRAPVLTIIEIGEHSNGALLGGYWQLANGQLHYRVHYNRVHYNGEPKTIIFNQIHEYDPIDPKYWFAHWNYIFGVWHSDSENMTIYLDTVYRSPRSRNFLGVYVLDGEEVRVMVEVRRSGNDLLIDIHDTRFFNTETGRFERPEQYESAHLLFGRFEVVDDRMKLRPTYSGRFENFPDEILFRRLDDYEEINPDDWFQNP